MAVTVVGLKEANRALKRLPKFAKDLVQPVMDKTAFRVSAIAAAKAAVDTGLLKRSIGWRTRPRSVGAEVTIDGQAWYWRIVERGAKFKKVHRPNLPARPFLRPAADVMREAHHRNVQKALTEAANLVERDAARSSVSGLL